VVYIKFEKVFLLFVNRSHTNHPSRQSTSSRTVPQTVKYILYHYEHEDIHSLYELQVV